jgi:hypothetical protein
MKHLGEEKEHRPVLLLVAAFSRYPEVLAWARRQLQQRWGPIHLASSPFPFTWSDYYAASMGSDLVKQFWAFESLIDPAELAAIKRATNQLEAEVKQAISAAESRPLNLDPGYLTEAKLVLATTKDRDHRLYLSQGIFGEVTLYYHRGGWKAREWTYPDYRQPEYHEFFDACRQYLRSCYHRR